MIEIFTPSESENRQEAFWYYGKQIASVTTPDGTIYSLESAGELRCAITSPLSMSYPDATMKSGEMAVLCAKNWEMTDDDLNDSEKFEFDMNNWFAIRELKPNTTEGPDDDLFIVHTYTDGIQKLVELIQELQNAEEEEAV